MSYKETTNCCSSLVAKSGTFLEFLVEFSLGSKLQDEVDPGLIVEITIKTQDMRVPENTDMHTVVNGNMRWGKENRRGREGRGEKFYIFNL